LILAVFAHGLKLAKDTVQFLIFHLQKTKKTLAPAMKQNHSIKECSPSLPPFQTRSKDYDLIFV
jgi:hypothetical protein